MYISVDGTSTPTIAIWEDHSTPPAEDADVLEYFGYKKKEG